MFQEHPREKPWLAWLVFGLWSVFIIVIAPLTRPLLRELADATDKRVLIYITVVVTVIAAAVAIRLNVLQQGRLSKSRLTALVFIVGLFAYFSLFKIKSPQESLHFLEYGFLGLVTFRAFSHRIHNVLIYPCTVLLCSCIGTYDEILQWVNATRIYDLRDIGWNATAACLSQLAIALGVRPPFIRLRTDRASCRILAGLIALHTALFMACLSNTPQAIAWYTQKFPPLDYLADNNNVMTEYGYKLHDDDIGTFYSRFTRDQVIAMDQARAAEVGLLLAENIKSRDYDGFLRRYTPAVDAFARECRVRLYRRDHYYLASFKHGATNEMYKFHMMVAYKENQILERYFSNTLAAAGAVFAPYSRKQIRDGMKSDDHYVSPVGEHLITVMSEAVLVGLLATLLVLSVTAWWKLRPPHAAHA